MNQHWGKNVRLDVGLEKESAYLDAEVGNRSHWIKQALPVVQQWLAYSQKTSQISQATSWRVLNRRFHITTSMRVLVFRNSSSFLGFRIPQHSHAVIFPTPTPLSLSIKNLCMGAICCDMLHGRTWHPCIHLQRIEKKHMFSFSKKAYTPAPSFIREHRRADP